MTFYQSIAGFILGTLLALSAQPAASQPTRGGCARGAEMGYVTVLSPTWMTDWRTRETAPRRLIPGLELRLCRFEGDNAVVTIWTEGYGYVLPRSDIGPVRRSPDLREVTLWDVACTGREITRIQTQYSHDQEWYLMDLAWDRDVSLEMLLLIRRHFIDRTISRSNIYNPDAIPVCEEVENTGPINRHLVINKTTDLDFANAQDIMFVSDSIYAHSQHIYHVNSNAGALVEVSLETAGFAMMFVGNHDGGGVSQIEDIDVVEQNHVGSWEADDAVGREKWLVRVPLSGSLRILITHSGPASNAWATSTYTLSVAQTQPAP